MKPGRLKEVAPDYHKAYPTLYEMSLTAEPDLPAEKRLGYIESYIRGLAARGGPAGGASLEAAQWLIAGGHYADGLAIIERRIPTPKPCKNSETVRLWYCKGTCLEQLGRNKEAIASYCHCAAEARRLKAGGMVENMARRALSRLGAGDGTEQSETERNRP
jgi:hypothetical protein